MNEKLFIKLQAWLSMAAMIFACLYFPYLLLQRRWAEVLNSLTWGVVIMAIFMVLAIFSPKLFEWVGVVVGVATQAYLKFFFNSMLVFAPASLFSWFSRQMLLFKAFEIQALSLSLWGIIFLVAIRVLLYEDKRMRFFKWLRERISGFAPWAYSINLIWIGVFFFASLTYILVEQGRISFATFGEAQISFDRYLDFYLWHFIKAIPGFAITDTLRWQEPLTYNGGWIGVLLLLFKITMISPVIGAFIWYGRFVAGEKQAAQKKQEEEQEKQVELTLGARQIRKTTHRTYRPRRRIWQKL